MKAYVPRKVRRRRQVMTKLIIWLVVAAACVIGLIIRYPWIIPGATDFVDRAKVYWDLATLPLTLKINAKDAVFWGQTCLL